MSEGSLESSGEPAEELGSYAGWYIGLTVVVVVIAIGIGLWFTYHH
jgi:hypothetical protein